MDRYELFRIWAPDESPWSPWVKPALFAHYRGEDSAAYTSVEESMPGIGYIAKAPVHCALVIDLPGVASIHGGVELALCGYRPIPIFASCPPDPSEPVDSAVDAVSILQALADAAPELAQIPILPEAPPAFLLDARRLAMGRDIADDCFDNRSVVFASDFPSASILRSHGIEGCRIIRNPIIPSGEDLARALLPWHRDRIEIRAVNAEGRPVEWRWPADGLWASLCHRFEAWMRLLPNPSGGFGQFPGASGG